MCNRKESFRGRKKEKIRLENKKKERKEKRKRRRRKKRGKIAAEIKKNIFKKCGRTYVDSEEETERS